MTRRLLDWIDRNLLLTVVALFALYLVWGRYVAPSFTKSSDIRRDLRIDRLQGDIEIACLWNSHGATELYPPSSFLQGARLAVGEINTQSNEGKGGGLLLPGPDGQLVARRLVMHEAGSGPETNWRTGSDVSANQLARDANLVAVVNNLADPTAQQAAVVFESAGVLNLASGGPSLGMSAPLLSTISLAPEFNARANALVRLLPVAISAALHRPVRSIGILFKERPPYNELSVQMLLKERSEANQVARVLIQLQRMVTRGDINTDTKVGDVVRRYRMLMSPTQLSELRKIFDRLSSYPKVREMTLKQLFIEFAPQQMLVDVPFVRSFSPFSTNFRDHLAAFQGAGADVLYILDDPVDATHIVRQFREMGIKTPVVLVDLADADRIAVELGGYADDIFSVSIYSAVREDAAFDAFRQAYRKFLTDQGLPPNEPDGQTMRGYESIYLLGDAIMRTRTTVPGVLAGAFEHSIEPWQGKLGTVYKFNQHGQVLNRPLYPVRMLHGKVVPAEVGGGLLPK